MTERELLSRASLARHRPDMIATASADAGIGIVHLGLGNFHRAHQAVYTEEAMARAGGDWATCGVMMRASREKQQAFARQGGLYSVMERGPQGTQHRVIGCLHETLVCPDDLPALMNRLHDPAVRIVSLTITEKGYCLDGRTGGLDLYLPDVAHDLAHPDAPITAPGLLVAALRRRREHPFAVMSCDNLQHNGQRLRRVVMEMAARQGDAALAAHIGEVVAFPSTMVDRITPATTERDIEEAGRHLGLSDSLAVACEPFRQWVIEDRFPLGRPAWELAGAQLVDDVRPFEQAKLRMLNGAHSTIACLALLAGHVTVADAMGDRAIRALVRSMMTDEIAPTLAVPATLDLDAYRDSLLERFANPALHHRCEQIAADGSQKLPQRLLATIADRLGAGAPFDRLGLAVAAWMELLYRAAHGLIAAGVQDPLKETLFQIVRETGADPSSMAASLIGVREVFAPSLAASHTFRAVVRDAAISLRHHGVHHAIGRLRDG